MSMILLVRSCLYDQPALAEDQAADHLINSSASYKVKEIALFYR
jgi:hypothetical protein